MINIFAGFPWWDRPAHRLLLCQFDVPKATRGFIGSDSWRSALGEPVAHALDRFVKADLLVFGALADRVAACCSVEMVARLLTNRGLLADGSVQDMAMRLANTDPQGMQIVVQGVQVLVWSKQGRSLGQYYARQAATERSTAEEDVTKALFAHDFYSAAEVVIAYEAAQAFPFGYCLGNSAAELKQLFDPALDVEQLRRLFAQHGASVSGVSPAQAEGLRVAAGFSYLWGRPVSDRWLARYTGRSDREQVMAARQFLTQQISSLSQQEISA